MAEFKRPLLPPGPLSNLVNALHDLHLAAGYPSARLLRSDIGGPGVLSHTSIHKLFTEPRLPTWGHLELVVETMACRAKLDEKGQVKRFRTLWTQAARPGSTATVPEAAVSAPVASAPAAGEVSEPLSNPFSALLPEALDEIEAANSPVGFDSRTRIPTGFADLDGLLGGWSQGCLIIIGGRASSGKTTLLLNFCRAASIMYAIPSMLLSGEMNNTELQMRMLSAEARVPLHTIRTGRMEEEDWRRFLGRLDAVTNAPIHIATPSRYRFEQISAEAIRLSQESGLQLILVDSLQWITAHSGSAQTSSAEASLWELKNLATTLKIPIIISAQAERYDTGLLANGPIPYLREGSAIEQVADVVIMLNRPDQDDLESPRAGEADLIVAKNRNGPTATATVAYQGRYSRFLDMVPVDHQGVDQTVEATGGSRSWPGGWAGPGQLLSCSFCGKHMKQVKKLIAGPDTHICDCCIDRVHTVLATVGKTANTPTAIIRRVSDDGRDEWCNFCGKNHHQVEAMAAAVDARICNECLKLCDEIIAEEH